MWRELIIEKFDILKKERQERATFWNMWQFSRCVTLGSRIKKKKKKLAREK